MELRWYILFTYLNELVIEEMGIIIELEGGEYLVDLRSLKFFIIYFGKFGKVIGVFLSCFWFCGLYICCVSDKV